MLLALLSWLACFVVLARLHTWLPFAFVGVCLTMVSLLFRAVPWALLKPSFRNLGLGVAGGVLMVLLTHLAYGWVSVLVPGVRAATQELLALLNVAGFSASARATLIIVIASCEEVLFRGLLPKLALRRELTEVRWPSPAEFTRLLGFALVYALTTAPLGSPLLVLCAFLCGSIWGVMRLATGSLIVPILAHVIWDLGVLLAWPLITLAR